MKTAIRFLGWLCALLAFLASAASHAAAVNATSSLSGSIVSGSVTAIGTESNSLNGAVDGAIVRCMLYNGTSGVVSQLGSSIPLSIAVKAQQSFPVSCALSANQLQALAAGNGTYAYVQIEQTGNSGKVIGRSPSTVPTASNATAPPRFVSPSLTINSVTMQGASVIVIGDYSVYVIGAAAASYNANLGWYTTRSALGNGIALGSFPLAIAPTGVSGVAQLHGSFMTTIDTSSGSPLPSSIGLYAMLSDAPTVLANASFPTLLMCSALASPASLQSGQPVSLSVACQNNVGTLSVQWKDANGTVIGSGASLSIPHAALGTTSYSATVTDRVAPVIAQNGVAAIATAVTIDFSGASELSVQRVYVAYYGRPADPAGLVYWAGRLNQEGSLASIIFAFGTSDEFNRRYGGLNPTILVTKIYQQTLGRDPDPAGLAYYVGELQAGRRTLQSITLDVLNGAQNADVNTVANRVDVANYYAAKVAAGCDYGGELTGVNTLATVTFDLATVVAAKQAIDTRCSH